MAPGGRFVTSAMEDERATRGDERAAMEDRWAPPKLARSRSVLELLVLVLVLGAVAPSGASVRRAPPGEVWVSGVRIAGAVF